MWVVYTIIAYFALAILFPVGWVLLPVWKRARAARLVQCPAAPETATVHLDPWFAMRRRALGGYEIRISGCSKWPERCDCKRECMDQLHSPV